MWLHIFFAVVLVVGANHCQDTRVNLDDLISSIFNTSDVPSTAAPPKTVISPTPPTKPNTDSTSRIDEYTKKSCGFEKECVEHFLCNNGTIIKDGHSIIDIRIDGAECHYLQKCCAISDQVRVETNF